MHSNMKVTHKLLKSKKLKMQLRVMMMMMMMMMMDWFNDNGNYDDDDVEIDDDDGNSGDDDVTVNEDVSNIKHLIVEICFLKHKTEQADEEIKFTFCSATLEQNDCTVLYNTTVLCTLDLITFNRILTQFTDIHVGGAILKTWQCTRSLHTWTAQHNKVDGW